MEKPAGLLTVPTAEREKRNAPFARRSTTCTTGTAAALTRGRPAPGQGDLRSAGLRAEPPGAQAACSEQFRDHTIVREYLRDRRGRREALRDFPRGALPRPRGRRRSVARSPGRRAPRGDALRSRGAARGRDPRRRAPGNGPHAPDPDPLRRGRPSRPRRRRVYRPPRMGPPPVEAPRQMLHARLLGFADPRTGRPVEAELSAARGLPGDTGAPARARIAGKRKSPGRPGALESTNCRWIGVLPHDDDDDPPVLASVRSACCSSRPAPLHRRKSSTSDSARPLLVEVTPNRSARRSPRL